MFDQETLSTCTYCPRLCRDVCPVAIGEAKETLIPTHKMSLIDLAQRGMLPFSTELAEIFFACTACGACTASCKHKMEPSSILYQGREEAFDKKILPSSVQTLLTNIEKQQNPYAPIPPSVQEREMPTSSIQLFLDAATCANQPEKAALLLQTLQKSKHPSASLFPTHLSSGRLLYAIGAREHHEQHKIQLQQAVDGLSHLYVADPYDYHYLKEHLAPKQDTPRSIMRKTHLLLALLEQHISILPTTTPTKLVMYHDSAPLGRKLGYYDLPRKILAKLGYQIIEFTRNKHFASDSAAGGIYRWSSPHGAKQAAKWLLKEVYEVTEAKKLSKPLSLVTVGETERSHLAASCPELTILDLNELAAKALLA